MVKPDYYTRIQKKIHSFRPSGNISASNIGTVKQEVHYRALTSLDRIYRRSWPVKIIDVIMGFDGEVEFMVKMPECFLTYIITDYGEFSVSFEDNDGDDIYYEQFADFEESWKEMEKHRKNFSGSESYTENTGVFHTSGGLVSHLKTVVAKEEVGFQYSTTQT